MSPPLGHVEGGRGEVHLQVHATSSDRSSQNCPVLTEHNYMRLSDSSSGDSSVVTTGLDEKGDGLNLKATELTLGLPGGSRSPVRSLDLSLLRSDKYREKSLLFLDPAEEGTPEAKQLIRYNRLTLQTLLSGNKRRFFDTMDGYSTAKSNVFVEGKLLLSGIDYETETAESSPDGRIMGNSELELMSVDVKAGSDTWHADGRGHLGAVILSPRPSDNLLAKNTSVKNHHGTPRLVKENVALKICQDRPHVSKEFNANGTSPADGYGFGLVGKEQVVGWPPIRSYRKNTLAANSKAKDVVQGKLSSGPLFIKVSMDGAPYLRKVDLKTCATYDELSSSLEKMFSYFTVGQFGSNRVPSRDVLSESKLMDFLHGSEYVITYVDKDGDWMLIGDVPWDMFVGFCKRIRIMKRSDAIGLGMCSSIFCFFQQIARSTSTKRA